MTDTSNEIRSEIASDGNLKISLESVNKPEPKDGEVLIKIEASPINPSDLGLLLGPADVSTLKVSDGVAQMRVPDALMRSVSARLDQSLPVGNEGAGVVESAGKGAEDLIGKVVGVAGGSITEHHWGNSLWGNEDFWIIKKEYRKGKTGLKLFNMLMKWFKDNGATRICMTHYSWNPKVGDFYEKKGFKPYEVNYVKEVANGS